MEGFVEFCFLVYLFSFHSLTWLSKWTWFSLCLINRRTNQISIAINRELRTTDRVPPVSEISAKQFGLFFRRKIRLALSIILFALVRPIRPKRNQIERNSNSGSGWIFEICRGWLRCPDICEKDTNSVLSSSVFSSLHPSAIHSCVKQCMIVDLNNTDSRLFFDLYFGPVHSSRACFEELRFRSRSTHGRRYCGFCENQSHCSLVN